MMLGYSLSILTTFGLLFTSCNSSQILSKKERIILKKIDSTSREMERDRAREILEDNQIQEMP